MPAKGETELVFASAEETLFWMARIDGIRSGKDVFGKPLVLVRLQWLYTHHDIRTWFQEDWLMESIKVLLLHMGRNEVVYSNHFNILSPEHLNLVPLEMSPYSNPLAPGGAWYWCGVVISVEHEEVTITQMTTAICLKGDSCRYSRSWHPDNDTMHYCDVCKVWLHRECATKWNGNLDNRKPYTELFKDCKSVNIKVLCLVLP
ncbi:hypothetical protein FOMPIDRAFT_1052020 [Fomitopsis schrenkii]|uniref:Uncharacterized protein n=1 Tax=Fomitopsis schrenkii TaxID=2126942 RepID=S8DZH9_FOMSC|nr:hypothetical protein FOMPIDRAFT_1052020 [Fomitopsis schrenkii]